MTRVVHTSIQVVRLLPLLQVITLNPAKIVVGPLDTPSLVSLRSTV